MNRLSRTLLSARSRKEAAQQIAQARQSVKKSLDRLGETLGESQKKITREVGLLTRGPQGRRQGRPRRLPGPPPLTGFSLGGPRGWADNKEAGARAPRARSTCEPC